MQLPNIERISDAGLYAKQCKKGVVDVKSFFITLCGKLEGNQKEAHFR